MLASPPWPDSKLDLPRAFGTVATPYRSRASSRAYIAAPIQRVQFGSGDVWTWTAFDADSKLLIGYLVGLRGSSYAFATEAGITNSPAATILPSISYLRIPQRAAGPAPKPHRD